MILLLEIIEELDVCVVVEKVLELMKELICLGSELCVIIISIGISLFLCDGWDVDILIKYVDVVMYYVKGSGCVGVCIFEEDFFDKFI